MLRIYQLATVFLYPFFLLINIALKFIAGPWQKRWQQGLAFGLPQTKKNLIWLHAVSVGELKVAMHLVKTLSNHDQYNFLITTTTFSAAALAKNIRNKKIIHCYMPFDFSWVVKRFIANFKPLLAIIVETEIWPNWLNALNQQKIPAILANARLSDRAMGRYFLAVKMFQQVLNQFSVIVVQSEQIAKRFAKLGVVANKMQIIDNLKYDLSNQDKNINLKAGFFSWSENKKTLLTASTHPKEEQIILKAFSLVRKQQPDCSLIIVPRHPERAKEIADLCAQFGFSTIRYAKLINQPNKTDVLIVDTFGDLAAFYAYHKMAFIGGSLIAHGGHNPIEAIEQDSVCLTGPYVFNFEDIYAKLFADKACVVIQNANDLAKTWCELLVDEQELKLLLLKAKKLLQNVAGTSSAKYAKLIQTFL